VGHFLRVYSYIFETVLCGAGMLLGGFAAFSSNLDVRVPWLPWNGPQQVAWILGLSVAGLVSVALAAFGLARTILFIFSAVVVGVLIRGLFVNTGYSFAGQSDARHALFLILGAVLAFIGAYPAWGKRNRRRA
jgi:hypothetical protein